MKNVLIFLSVFLLNIGFAFSVDCGDIDCPQGWTPAESGCIQQFKYCWDTSETPWRLKVTKYGEPIPYGQPDCFLPISPAPNYVLIHPCISFCQ